MTFRASALLLFFVAASPNVHYFRYERPVLNTPAQNQQACLTLDPATFTHSGPQLSSLRLYRGETEAPYALNYAAPAESSPRTLVPLNVGLRGGSTTFDVAMPEGTYNDLDLGITGKNFIATVYVSGSQTQLSSHSRSGAREHATSLGSYSVFDFTRQKLGRSTVLHLPQSDFRYLHFRIDGPIKPEQISGVTTEHLRQVQPRYVTVAASSTIKQQGRDSLIEFSVPANLPVDRINFAPGAQPVNFSRNVTARIAQTPAPRTEGDSLAEPQWPETFSGSILRIHTTRNGHKIDEEDLAIDVPTYATSFAPAGTKWTITVHNQDDAPVQFQSVALQMIARDLCFDANAGQAYALYYGDKALSPPHYDYAQLFTPDKNAVRVALGAERQNPQYQDRPDTRPFTEKHPALLWIVLIAAVAVLASIALRSSRQIKEP